MRHWVRPGAWGTVPKIGPITVSINSSISVPPFQGLRFLDLNPGLAPISAKIISLRPNICCMDPIFLGFSGSVRSPKSPYPAQIDLNLALMGLRPGLCCNALAGLSIARHLEYPAGISFVRLRKTPQGWRSRAQGVSPGNRESSEKSPERAAQGRCDESITFSYFTGCDPAHDGLLLIRTSMRCS